MQKNLFWIALGIAVFLLVYLARNGWFAQAAMTRRRRSAAAGPVAGRSARTGRNTVATKKWTAGRSDCGNRHAKRNAGSRPAFRVASTGSGLTQGMVPGACATGSKVFDSMR
jgi:hypothetical protein